MEPRQAVSTELARATVGILISWSELKYCFLLAQGRGRVLRISISRLSISTRILSIHGNYPLRDSLLHDTNNCGILSRWQPFQLCLLYLRDIFPYSSFRGSRRDPRTRPITPSIKRPLPHHLKRPRPGPLFLFVCAGRPLIVRGPVPRNPNNIDCWLLAQIFTTIVWRHLWERQFSMHLRSRNPPRPSASSPLDNRAPPMANTSQVSDLEGLHHEILGMAKQMRVINENNARLIQLLAAANPQPPAAPSVPDVERSRHSNRSGDRSHNTDPPFTERVLGARISSKFKLPTQLGIYEGKTDPMDHLDLYKSLMSLQGCSDEVMCKAFSATLKEPARNRQKNASHLFTVHQKEIESLKDFVKRFNQAILEVEDPIDKVIIMAMMEGLRPGPLFDSLSKNVPETLSALQSKADKYIAAEELAEAKRRQREKDDHKRKEPDTRRNDYREDTRYKRPDRDPKRSNNRRPRTPPRRPEFILPPLNAPVAQLKEQIADLIKRGYLRKYVTDRPPLNSLERKYGDNRPTAGNIYKRSMEFSDQVVVRLHPGKGMPGVPLGWPKKEIYNLSSPCVGDQPPITFSNDDLRGLHLPHDDALVVSAVIANFNVQRILIDSGSSADILFISAFEKNENWAGQVAYFPYPPDRIWRKYDAPPGMDQLPITLGTEPHQTTVWQDFIVVDCPSPYNAILGRPTLGGIKAITSTYHLKIKFPALTGIGEVKGDQKVARQCFISAMKLTQASGSPIKSSKRKENPTWMDEIIAYLQKGILPKDKLQARHLQYRSARFCIFKGKLYKRSFSGPLLRCLRPEEAEYVLTGNTRRHMRKSLRSQVIGEEDYSPRILLDDHRTRCGSIYKEMRQMPEVCPRQPSPSHRDGTDVQPLAIRPVGDRHSGSPTASSFAEEIRSPEGHHLGNNARQFDNDKFRLFCSDLAISHHFSSPGHLQANGQVEVTNRTILRNLKARLERSKSEWAENLPSILWAYHTTSRIPTGETPYSMVFGTKSVVPVEIGMPSFRISNFDKESNEAELRLNLDLLEEKRENAGLRQMAYKCQVAKYYNQRVRHRSFLPGDLVLQKVTLPTKEPNAGKLGPTWEGPYKVLKVSRPGTYWLEDLNGKTLLHPWNAEHLKKILSITEPRDNPVTP
ncbi:hypothetical protein Acr_27g0001530 [Actinidia rufa]|uniref:Integrase catalytic domain-containing protein n=1 Tax=Actinidia rufa TaxID=165716 RepID=A0A7J0H6N4_9ERIC|nr:hypothetical protein Acr_27g0001530 [Actinidia rufa]